VLVAATVIAGHLLQGFGNSRVDDGLRNGLHVLVFAIVAIIIFEYLVRSGISTLIATLMTAILVAIIGVSAEFLQYLSGRKPDVFDVMRDFSGAILALIGRTLWIWTKGDGKATVTRLVGRAMSVAVSILVFTPLAFWLSIIVFGRMSSPVILDFEQWWAEYIYRPINAELAPHDGPASSVEIGLSEWGRSGLVISPVMSDWSNYEFLSITAGVLEGPDTRVSVRINDSARHNIWSDQFLAWIVVDSTVSIIRIPLRDLVNEPGHATVDLSDIQELVFFARDKRSNTVMLISGIRLE